MGTNNSKENSNLMLTSVDNNNAWHAPIKNKPTIINKTMTYYGWQEISRCSHIDWLNGISGND